MGTRCEIKSNRRQSVDRSDPFYQDNSNACTYERIGLVSSLNVPHSFYQPHLGLSASLLHLFSHTSQAGVLWPSAAHGSTHGTHRRNRKESRLPSTSAEGLSDATSITC